MPGSDYVQIRCHSRLQKTLCSVQSYDIQRGKHQDTEQDLYYPTVRSLKADSGGRAV